MTLEEKLKMANEEPRWMYEFDLGDGVKTPLLAEELRSIHSTRERMIMPIVDCFFPEGLQGKSCLDVACNEGYFSHLLYHRGATVRGIDIRETNVGRARWVQAIFGYNSKRMVFEVEDFFTNRDPEGEYDLTLFLGILYHVENPMGALRLLSRITRKLSVIETQLTRQDSPVSSGWGQTSVNLELESTLALMQEADTNQNNLAALDSLSFIPNASAVRQMLFAAGFSHVMQAAAKPGSNPQYVKNDRAVFFALK